MINDVNLVNNLKFDLLSVSKLCDEGRSKVIFYSKEVFVKDLKTKEILIKGKRHKQIYKVDESFDPSSSVCLSTLKEDTRTWHKRLGHASTRLVNKLFKKDLVIGLPRVEAYMDGVCGDYARGKQHKVSLKNKKVINTKKPLELVHIDFCGPMRTRSLN